MQISIAYASNKPLNASSPDWKQIIASATTPSSSPDTNQQRWLEFVHPRMPSASWARTRWHHFLQ